MNYKYIISSFILAYSLSFLTSSCKDDDNDNPGHVIPNVQWSETLKGNGEEVGAYPDLYSNYWEYTYDLEANNNKALCFSGQFPHCRYFSFSLYDDETGSAIGGIDDLDIEPDEGTSNPFRQTVSQPGRFTVYVVPENAGKGFIDGLNSKNICTVKSGVKKVAVCIRQYLGTDSSGKKADEYGGVELPLISAIDMITSEATDVPEHILSNIYNASSNSYILKSDEFREVPFFLSPVSKYYPNNSTSYLYARTRLRSDSILSFSFIPAPIPQKAEDYDGAAARYWSICVGSAADTRSYASLCDVNADWEEGIKTHFAICLKNNPRLSEIEEKVRNEKNLGKKINLIVWDSEKTNIDGKPLGEYIALMYRNILPNPNWPYSISNMLPTDYYDSTGEPIDHVTQPERQLAHIALGDYGPLGIKESTSDFLK